MSKQQELFPTDPMPWELDAQDEVEITQPVYEQREVPFPQDEIPF